MLLSKFARINLAHRNTPLELMPRLSEHLGGPNIYIKRDDCTGLGHGGNKARKLEFILADAINRGADTILTQGAVQSNHARQTAAAAAKLGLKCELLLENFMLAPDSDYKNSGNLFLDHLFGAKVHYYPKDTDMGEALDAKAAQLSAEGRTPYIVPLGGSNVIGNLGYVDCAMEIIQQANQQQILISQIIHATGSAGTQAGLITGLRANQSDIPVLGIAVSTEKQKQEEKVFKLAQETATFLGQENVIKRNDIDVNSDYFGEGYGLPTDSMKEALSLVARLEGILLDPVYTGKAMAGLIDLVRRGIFSQNDSIVFIHTGGSAALFAYYKHLL